MSSNCRERVKFNASAESPSASSAACHLRQKIRRTNSARCACPHPRDTRLLNQLVNAARTVHASIRWNWLGFAIGFAIVAISVFTLFRLLKDIDIDEIFVALHDIPDHRLVLAAVFVLLGYCTLMVYDWFALRTIRVTHVPYRVAAFTSFTAYTIGHNIGATAFSAGAIRYRIYSARGLGVLDVANICFITGLTFWLGNLTVLGIGMVSDPVPVSAIDQLPAWLNRTIGVVLLCGIAAYVVWAAQARRSIGRGGIRVVLPTGASTVLQIVIGIVDLTFCSLAMYMLIPSSPPIAFTTLAVVFISATLLGFASHAPGSIGVFDAAMLVALSQFDKEELVAGLLVFRFLYFMIPFACALLLMAARETMVALRGTDKPR